jgi:uncharacterized protein (TIRG00374 family)
MGRQKPGESRVHHHLRSSLRLVAGIGFSAFLLYLALIGVDWNRVLSGLRSAQYGYLLPILLISFLTLYLRAVRWQFFLHPLGRMHFQNLLSSTCIGFMANMLLPLRIGELIRPFLLSRKERVEVTTTLATIVTERVFDLISLLGFFMVLLFFLPLPKQVQHSGLIVSMGAMILLAALICSHLWKQNIFEWLDRPFFQKKKSVAGMRRQFLLFMTGLEILSNTSDMLKAFAYSLLLWLSIGLIYSFGLHLMGLDVPFLSGGMAISVIVALAVSLPSTPGYVGAFEFGCKVGLLIFGIRETEAFSYSIILHLSQFTVTVAAGLFFLVRENLTLSELRRFGRPA